MIKKYYGTTFRPAVIYFHGNVTCKATCRCPVEVGRVCCHFFALLLYLKHCTDTKEKILELTCTQQLQKWHHRSKKSSIPIVSINKIGPADPNSNSSFRRNVPSIIANLNKKFKQEKPIEADIHPILMNSSLGRSSSGIHLNYLNSPA